MLQTKQCLIFSLPDGYPVNQKPFQPSGNTEWPTWLKTKQDNSYHGSQISVQASHPSPASDILLPACETWCVLYVYSTRISTVGIIIYYLLETVLQAAIEPKIPKRAFIELAKDYVRTVVSQGLREKARHRFELRDEFK